MKQNYLIVLHQNLVSMSVVYILILLFYKKTCCFQNEITSLCESIFYEKNIKNLEEYIN